MVGVSSMDVFLKGKLSTGSDFIVLGEHCNGCSIFYACTPFLALR